MRFLLAVFIVLFVSTQTAFAQSDSSSFSIQVFGGQDTEAPTTPTLLSVTPVATSQIDLAWSTATDNFMVSGYVVYQDGTPIATTTLTTYSDLGLTASTTYTYYIQAFDPSFNYSSSSNSIAATTPDNSSSADDGSGQSSGTVVRTVLDELQITPGVSTSTFFIKTARPARFELRWGRTNDFEMGYVVHDHFVDTYKTTLTGLEPSTTYEYEIIGYTPSGIATILKQGQFSTLGLEDIYPPANVSRFMAVSQNDDVALSWQLPFGEEYEYVRIVRSHLGFPVHPYEGAIVYQGRGEHTLDEGILNNYSPVYYTAFVVDAAGNVSSGAVAKVFASSREYNGSISPEVPGGTGDTVIPLPETVASTSPSLPPEVRMPSLAEIFLYQGNRTQNFAQMEPILDSANLFVVSIPKDAVSDHLKTIILTITDPTNAKQSSAFLLRLNKDNTAYEAVIAPLQLEGMSRLTVDVYDYSSAVVGTFGKTVAFKQLAPKHGIPFVQGMSLSDIGLYVILIGLPILLALLIFLFLYRRRSRD
jgi:hypothetical protein